ncbi:ATP-binding cassette domain-containing protein [Tumebacillus sp. DT12]|uniref:ATP-binding cassette domain-containing protein n=1 Tax=Tumebacillus lacus TaxID=2995335 RepID=A0ABT3WZZ1_9BACL|nr:ATP-binding cassette domain-containing protein [Tumebacillus lacus]MCX7570224.1 ATP-binding cassette domain-containing protein [Tumebacillus lacus]
MTAIDVRNLTKHYKVPIKQPGLLASVKSLFSQEYEEKHAVEQMSFQIEAGEIVGLLGSNGAGKTTMMKMLSGILHPTSGTCSVLGYTPWERKQEFQKSIAMIMGQKNSLWWDLPAADSFLLNKEIYDIPDKDYHETLNHMVEILDVKRLLTTPVRNLSLGERMKMEIIAGFLHQPKVVFLDEPTIGLDLTSQYAIRDFIRTMNSQRKVTIILTSHYMADIQELCKRVIIVNKGTKLYDGQLSHVAEDFSDVKLISIDLERDVEDAVLASIGEVVGRDVLKVTLQVPRNEIPQAIAKLGSLPVVDVNISEIPIDRVIERTLAEGKVRVNQ